MSENANETIKEKIFDLVVKHIPIQIIFSICMYCVLLYGCYKIWFSIINGETIKDEDKNNYLSAVLAIMFILTILFIISIIILIIRQRKKVKKEDSKDLNESDTKIVAHIIDASNDKARNGIYLNVNQGVQKSYKVYGTSLHSIANDHEDMLLKMAENNVNIKLCMMNPDITDDELCKKLIEKDLCVMSKFFDAEENSMDNFKEKKSKVLKNYNDPLNKLKIYISTCYIKDYFNTATDYKQRLKSSYEDLNAIVMKIKNKGHDEAEIRIKNSFIPISITIADAENEFGKMVVEFYIPYTSKRVLIELNKQQHENLFNGFLEFYESLWNSDKNNQK